MRLMIDANIIVDILCKREPFYEESAMISKLCETEIVDGHITALTFANIVYIMRKEIDAEKIVTMLNILSRIFHIESLTLADLNTAASLQWNDFEDAIQEAIAERIKADMIITRNGSDYNGSKITVKTPTEFVKEIAKKTL